jgi:hypothetical protein
MAVHRVREKPVIVGYIVSEREGGGLKADRIEPLSDYQITYGCSPQAVADGARELEWLCLAARVYAELVARAEKAMREDQYPTNM